MTWLVVLALAAADVGIDEHVGERVPGDIVLSAGDGARVATRELFDGHRPVVLVMAYSRCEMLCSLVLRGAARAITTSRYTAGVDFLPVVVSLDPRETLAIAAHHQAKLLADIGFAGERTRWPYFVGDAAAIARLAGALGFRYAWDERTQQYAHPVVMFVLSPDGRIAEYLRGVTFDGLDDAIDRASAGVLTPSVARDVLRCFHFDPALRKYGRQMQLFLRFGAATIVLALLCAVIAFAIVRRRRSR